jgi:hypothetical protein
MSLFCNESIEQAKRIQKIHDIEHHKKIFGNNEPFFSKSFP